jgi:glycosyltransferase involved in cell wall biosynthesis
MKITIATGLYPPEIGGPATYATMLESELPDKGIEVSVVPFGWVRHYPKIIRHFVYAYKLWRESKGSDIIYALDPVSVGVPAMLVSKLTRKTFLVRVPGDYAWEQGQLRFGVTDRLHDFIEKRLSYGFRVSLLCRLEGYVARQARQVVVPSNYLKQIVEKWSVDSKKITVINSSLHKIEIGESREAIRKQFNFTDPTLVSAGRLVPNKGFIQLIKVFSRIKKTHPKAQLVIVGDGPQESAIEDLLLAEDLVSSVRLMGSLTQDALGAVIKGADVFVLNTAHEGLSHQLIEVMDLGTPIVTTNVGGNPELITNGVEGLLVEYNDTEALEEAICRVLNHPESVERMIQSARARSKDFDRGRTIEQIAQLLQTYKK